MIRRLFILITLSLIVGSVVMAQNKNVELSIQFLSHDKIGDVNFKVDPFAAHGKKVVDVLEAFFAAYQKPQEIVILETLYPKKNPTYTIHARPAMLVTDMDAVLEQLQKTKAVKGKLVPFHLAYILQIKGGIEDKKQVYVPDMKLPIQLVYEKLEDASLSSKRELIQAWAQEEVIPILGAFQSKVDAKFEGVKAMGKTLNNMDWEENNDILSLTELNPNYWRASVEMSVGNQLNTVSKIFLHIANGEFDYVKMYLDLLPSFEDPASVSGYYLKELKWRLDIFNAELEAQINGGVLMHDAGKFSAAIKTYKRILGDYPNSAWALYELYFSRNTQNIKEGSVEEDDRAEWDAAKGAIYSCNPLYPIDVRASTGREGYLLFRRGEIQSLFQERENINKDFLKLADIAMDLKVYGFAAHFYWLGLTSIPKKDHSDRELIFYFLYCLDKLGNTQIRESFKGDMDAEFKRISDGRETLMKESTLYKSFDKGE